MTRGKWALVVVALVVVNLPFALALWRQHQISSDGVRTEATIVAVAAPSGGKVPIQFRFPRDLDPDQTVRSTVIDQSSYQTAQRSKRIGGLVLRGNPSAFELDGQVRSRASLWVTVIADALVLLLLLLRLRMGGRWRRPALVALAMDDLEEGGEEPLLDKQSDGTYVICGEVKERRDGTVVLALPDRDVTVHLQGHADDVDAERPVQVRAQLVG